MKNQKEDFEDLDDVTQEDLDKIQAKIKSKAEPKDDELVLNSNWTVYQKSTFQKHGKPYKLRKFISELNNDLRKKFNKNFDIRLKNAFCDDKFKTLQLEYLKIVNEEFKKISDNQIKKSE